MQKWIARCDSQAGGFYPDGRDKPSKSGEHYPFGVNKKSFTFYYEGTHKEAFSRARILCRTELPAGYVPRSVLQAENDEKVPHFKGW